MSEVGLLWEQLEEESLRKQLALTPELKKRLQAERKQMMRFGRGKRIRTIPDDFYERTRNSTSPLRGSDPLFGDSQGTPFY